MSSATQKKTDDRTLRRENNIDNCMRYSKMKSKYLARNDRLIILACTCSLLEYPPNGS